MRSFYVFVTVVFFVMSFVFPVYGGDGGAMEELGTGSLSCAIKREILKPPVEKALSAGENEGNGIDHIEYLYGVGRKGIYLVQLDHPVDEVSSGLLFPFEQQFFYGAAGSGDSDFFWATSYGYTVYGYGSALYKVYPGERAAVQIGDDYGQNPRYPADPNYVIRMMELAYDDDGDVLYGTDYLGLYTIDRTTGQGSYIDDFGNGVDGKLIDMVFSMGYDSQSQKLFIANQKTGEDETRLKTHVYTVNPATAGVTYVGDSMTDALTDVYESHTSNELYACSNWPHAMYGFNSGSGAVTLLGPVADNILGLGGDFAETVGPQVWFPSVSTDLSATSYSELGGQRNDAADSDRGGWDHMSSVAGAFTQETGQASGVGQETSMVVSSVSTHDLVQSTFSPSIDFSSVYDGPNSHGRGGGTATVNWTSALRIIADDTYLDGDRVIVLVDGRQVLNDEISHYVLDWELEIYDSRFNRPALLLTEEDVPTGSAPFLGAFHAVVGYTNRYEAKFSLTLDIDMLAGDISNDGKVDLTDFSMLGDKWMADDCSVSNLWCGRTDIDQSGDVGLDDLAIMSYDWVEGNAWDDDNEFDLDMNFIFRSIALPEALQTINDECADAISIMSDTEYFGSTQTATGTDISSCGLNDIYDVWYKFVPRQGGLYKIIVASTKSFSSCVSVYDGCGGSELYCWDQNNSARYFEANAWTNYYIRVADYGSSRGDFKFMVAYYRPPANDECSGALPVELWEIYQGETYGATNDSTSSCGTDDNADVWYEYTADDYGTAVFTVYPQDWDEPYFTASVFDSCDAGSRTELACAVYESYGDSDPKTVLVLENTEPGETYYIRISRNDNNYGKFDLNVEPGPDNDDCANAETIDIWDYTDGSTAGATGSDVTSCGVEDSRDVWYTVTSSEDQLVLFKVYDYSYSGVRFTVSAFDLCDGTELACSVSSDEGEYGEGEMMAQLIYEMSTDQTVYIRVAYEDDAMGDFDIEVTQVELPGNDDCGSAEELYDYTSGWTLGATGSDENSCGTDDTHDVWYAYTPETTGDYNLHLYAEEGSFEGTITVYDGDSCSPLPTTELGCGETGGEEYAELYVGLTEGKTYLIRVASDDAGRGYFGLDIYSGG